MLERPPSTVEVYLEVGRKRQFAVALAWPGWARSGRDEEAALAALDACGARYGAVVAGAGLVLPEASFQVVERLQGNQITDFGALTMPCTRDLGPVEPKERLRWAEIMKAGWNLLDEVAARAPAELRKGPRGGGRDTAAIVEHVANTERMQAAMLGGAGYGRGASVAETRSAILAGLAAAEGRFESAQRFGMVWTPLFAARRSAWHALDHAWEIEDRSLPA